MTITENTTGTEQLEYTTDEMMSVAAARALRDGTRCFVGIGLPSTAANLARTTHAPGLVLVYESGTLGSKPARLPASIGDGILAETADAVISVPEVFNYWLQPGRIDVGFLGAAQIDKYGNVNTTVIGDYAEPKVRLPGAGGAPKSPRRVKRCSSSCGNRIARSSRGSISSPRLDTAAGETTAAGWGCAARDRPW